ncbi:MAG: hypothetical protein IJ722_00925 [Alloprevotella sp.]|nr:hypothetical protein [Alloprevotella sp.]
MKTRQFIATLALVSLPALTFGCNGQAGKQTAAPGKAEHDQEKAESVTARPAITLPEILLPGPIDPIWEDNGILALGRIGRFDNMESLRHSPFYKLYCSCYPELEGINEITVDTGCGDLWIIRPRMENTSLAINEYTFAMFAGETPESDGRVLYRTENAPAILVRMAADDPGTIRINAVNDEGYSLSWIPTQDPRTNLLRIPDGAEDITFEVMQGFAEMGTDYTATAGGKQATLRFYGDKQLYLNGQPGTYEAFHTQGENIGIAIYFNIQGAESLAYVGGATEDYRSFTLTPAAGEDFGAGKGKAVTFGRK